MKRVAILGSTGSVGVQTLDVIRRRGDDFRVVALACRSDIDALERQIHEFGVNTVAVFDDKRAAELRRRTDIDVLTGPAGLAAIASLDTANLVVNALVGSVGIEPTAAAVRSGKTVALANKETLVAAGRLIMDLAQKHGAAIVPVDSEHSAIFQCLNGEKRKSVKRVVLTCSGGAFRDRTAEELRSMTPSDALQHPSWNMGAKITIDSATLMNKGLEVIEAAMLFGVDYDDIDVVIHPQSVIHSMVEFVDTSVIAQLGLPDMRLPIQYALTYPERVAGGYESLDFTTVGRLSFFAPDHERFPCLGYAIEAGKTAGSLPCVLNAANEAAVHAFLAGGIGFMDIPDVVRRELDDHDPIADPDLEEIIELDGRIKREVGERLKTPNASLAQGR